MRKDFGAKTWVYPMPVFIVASYDKDGSPCCMNGAWGGIYDTNQIMLCLADDHKTTKNIVGSGAFTVSIADAKHVVEADYVGIVSGNKIPDKMVKAGLTTTKSTFVNAPIINEFPMAVECKLVKFNEDGICIGEILNVSADESVLGADGQIAPQKLEAITYDPVHHTYIKLGEDVGKLQKTIPDMETAVQKYEKQEEKYKTELEKALAEFRTTRDNSQGFDEWEVIEERLHIRPQKEKEFSEYVYTCGKSINPKALTEAVSRVDGELLHENLKEEKLSIREKLRILKYQQQEERRAKRKPKQHSHDDELEL